MSTASSDSSVPLNFYNNYNLFYESLLNKVSIVYDKNKVHKKFIKYLTRNFLLLDQEVKLFKQQRHYKREKECIYVYTVQIISAKHC